MAVNQSPSTDRFVLRQVSSIEWTVVDETRGAHDPRRTVARIYEADEFEYDVCWEWDLPLPTKYMCVVDVIEDVRRATQPNTRALSRKPIPIPHRAPVPMVAG